MIGLAAADTIASGIKFFSELAAASMTSLSPTSRKTTKYAENAIPAASPAKAPSLSRSDCHVAGELGWCMGPLWQRRRAHCNDPVGRLQSAK